MNEVERFVLCMMWYTKQKKIEFGVLKDKDFWGVEWALLALSLLHVRVVTLYKIGAFLGDGANVYKNVTRERKDVTEENRIECIEVELTMPEA